MRIFILSFSMAAFMTASLSARPIQIYDYERLFKEADLVVIASALHSKETDDKENALGEGFVGTNTTFVIKHILQGESAAAKIDVLHFKFVGKMVVINGPNLADFVIDRDRDRVMISPHQAPQYMLFLTRMPDGRYAPVTGQVDSCMSFRKMSIPPEHEGEKKSK